MTDESTGEIVLKDLEIQPEAFKSGPFHEEDEKGSTTIYYDVSTKRGSVTVMKSHLY
jgi:hypothetical protein